MENLVSMRLSNDNTVDRETETKFILNVMENKTADLLILYAESGVGKSTLSNRVLKSSLNYIPICVRTNPENKNNFQSEGIYLSKVFNCIVSFFYAYKNEYPECCFDYYISHNKNASTKREALETMFSGISSEEPLNSSGMAIGKYVVSKLFKLYEYNSFNKLILSNKDSMILAHEYIKYILHKTPICLNIDNLQNIDHYSLQLLIEWISVSVRQNFFLFEYTIDPEFGTHSLIEFAQKFQILDLDVQLLPLGALEPCLYRQPKKIRINKGFTETTKIKFKVYNHI